MKVRALNSPSSSCVSWFLCCSDDEYAHVMCFVVWCKVLCVDENIRGEAVIDEEPVNLGEAMGGFELTGLSFGCCASGAPGLLCVSAKVGPPGFFSGVDVE